MSEWLDVIPWMLGAAAVTLGFLIFPAPAAESLPTQAEPRGAEVISLAEFRQRRLQKTQESGTGR